MLLQDDLDETDLYIDLYKKVPNCLLNKFQETGYKNIESVLKYNTDTLQNDQIQKVINLLDEGSSMTELNIATRLHNHTSQFHKDRSQLSEINKLMISLTTKRYLSAMKSLYLNGHSKSDGNRLKLLIDAINQIIVW